MENNEQWKHGGNCEFCRRSNYCSTPCTLKKRRDKAILRSLVANTLNRATGGVMGEAINKVCDNYMV